MLGDGTGGNIFIEIAGPTDGFPSHLTASTAIVESLKFGGRPWVAERWPRLIRSPRFR